MKLQLIRNATLKLSYAGKTLLIDPMLCPKNTFAPFVKGLLPNPTIDLTMPVDEVIRGINAVLVTHSHPDHFDKKSQEILPKDIPLFCTPDDHSFKEFEGFTAIEVVHDQVTWEGISIIRIEGQHGSGPVLPYMGKVSGYLLQTPQEPSVYLVSDSILVEEVRQAIVTYQPAVVVVNAGGGILPGFEQNPVLMDEAQVIQLAQLAPQAKVVAVHLDSIDFCKTTRASLRQCSQENGLSEKRLLIPDDGEEMVFEV